MLNLKPARKPSGLNNPVKEVLKPSDNSQEGVFFVAMNAGNRFKRIATYFLFLACLLTGSKIAMAQAPFLSATATKSTAGTNEQFQLTYTLNASGQRFQGPDLSDFYVHSGPNQSNSMQYVNGNFSQSISITYLLQPKKEGSYKIGPASIEVEGKRIVSNVVNLTVVKGAPQQQQQQQSQESGISSKNIFVRAVTNKSSVYQGEAVVVSFRIYTNVSILNYTVNKMPAFNGFFSQDIQLPEQLELTTEVIDGVSYRTGEIKKLVLFPQQSGELVIDPMELECIARIQVKSNRRDPFGMFNDPFFNDPFFGGGARDVKHSFKSSPVKIQVKSLPSGAPSGFSGTVGKVNYDVSLDKEITRANEPISLKIKVSGSGNLKLTDAPQVTLPPDFEVYDPKITENIKTGTGGSNGSKTFEYLIIPRNEGTFTIEPIPFSYFDLEKKQYITNPGKTFTVKVGRGTGQPVTTSGVSSVKQSDIQLMGRDIRYIKLRSEEFREEVSGFHGSTGFYLLSITPLLLFTGLLVYRNKTQKLNADIRQVRTRKATGAAQKRLKAASDALAKNNTSVVYEEISRALWGYVSDKLLIDPALLTKETAAAELAQRNVSEESISKWKKLLEDCEMARYAGAAAAPAPEVYRDSMELITVLENSLKG